ncbi:MAG: hypothetical protein U1E08_07630 [Coriobacteriia bacterium]|nr:hypothetical protein [Coriobacteriia bacterium]
MLVERTPVPRLAAALLLTLAISLATACGGAGTSQSLRQAGAAVPEAVLEDIGGSTVAAAAESDGPYPVGIAILDRTSTAPFQTISVATWVRSDWEGYRLLHGNAPWKVTNVLVEAEDGVRVFDDAATRPIIRSLGPVIVALGNGEVFQSRASFSLDRPGAYRVFVVAEFAIRSPEATGTVFTSDQFEEYRVVTPAIAITIE